jgi:uncharacterized membrane protein YdbT with pleckstrin-like domain
MTYYVLTCLLSGPLFPILIVPAFFRYHTMRYRFDADGISMRWGILFRREVNLTYARVQDIHLTSNLVERWLGLAKIQIQTASGSSTAEMTLEGLENYETVRDFLYARMRGHHGASTESPSVPGGNDPGGAVRDTLLEAAESLRQAAAELRRARG